MSDKNIFQRIHAVMKAVNGVAKDGHNDFFKFNYSSHDGVVNALRNALIDNGLVLTMSLQDHAVTPMETTKGGSTLFTDIVVVITLTNIDNPEDSISNKYHSQAFDVNELGPGKAMSYAKKYFLLNTFLLPTNSDPEGDAGKNDVKHTNPNKPKGENATSDVTTQEKTLFKTLSSSELKHRIQANGISFASPSEYNAALRDFALKERNGEAIDWNYVNAVKEKPDEFISRFISSFKK